MKKWFLILFSITQVTWSFVIQGTYFDSLSGLKEFAAFHQEFPQSDNKDWIDPDYSSFYETIKPGFFQTILSKVGLIKKNPCWDSQELKDLLAEVTEHRLEQKKDSVDYEDITLPTKGRCVIWGDLHGAFHSLVRDLEKLYELGIIDDSLKIITPETNFIVIGDAISRSPYSVELLTVLLRLMKQNPENFFYIRGNHETDAYWQNFGMRRSLRSRALSIAVPEDKEVPLSSFINKFFATLPRAVSIGHRSDKDAFAYCSHKSLEQEILGDKRVQVMLLGERRLSGTTQMKPLDFQGFTYGVSEWSMISSPTRVYRDYFDFNSDAFVILEMSEKLSESILSLYSRDVRTDNDFSKTDYDIIFGMKLTDHNDMKKKVRREPHFFATTLPLTGSLAVLGRSVNWGLQAAVKEVNENGGVGGHFVKPLVFDDQYVPRFARKNIETFHKDYKVDSVVVPVGSPTLASYSDRAKSDTALLFPYSGGPQFRDPELKYSVHFRASYKDEALSLIDYLVKVYGIKKFAFFYQDDDYGLLPMKAAKEELERRGLEAPILLPYGRAQTDFTDIVKKLRETNPEAVGCFSASLATQELISKIGPSFFLGRPLFGISFLENEMFNRFLNDRGVEFIFSAVVPDPTRSDLPIVRDYRKAMDAVDLPYGTNSLESYIALQLYFDALRHIKVPYTKEKIVTYFEGLKNYKFGGFTFTFRPEVRGFVLPVWIRTVDEKWLEYKV